MRPAHCAREVRGAGTAGRSTQDASMRPAHCAREVLLVEASAARKTSRFNEARALCAGSYPLLPKKSASQILASMRPAHCAREVRKRNRRKRLCLSCFNEARALCAGSSSAASAPGCAWPRFNEARALCAGSLPGAHRLGRRPRRFNEARALCAGSCRSPLVAHARAAASMRPAHCAREVASIGASGDLAMIELQ